MEQLIKITEHNGKKAVSARSLHTFLEIETRFDIWIGRMMEYGFIENVDCSKVVVDNQLFAIDWALTIETAKHWSMMQRTPRGMEARNYFIAMEKIAIEGLKPKELSRKQLALMVIEAEEALELSQAKVKELEPKAEVYDNIANADNNISLNEAAKSIGIGRNLMMQRMRATKILLANNTPPQHLLNAGYFVVKITNLDHLGRNQPTTFVTPKGLIWLSKTINQ